MDNSGQFWTNHDNFGQFNRGGQSPPASLVPDVPDVPVDPDQLNSRLAFFAEESPVKLLLAPSIAHIAKPSHAHARGNLWILDNCVKPGYIMDENGTATIITRLTCPSPSPPAPAFFRKSTDGARRFRQDRFLPQTAYRVKECFFLARPHCWRKSPFHDFAVFERKCNHLTKSKIQS